MRDRGRSIYFFALEKIGGTKKMEKRKEKREKEVDLAYLLPLRTGVGVTGRNSNSIIFQLKTRNVYSTEEK